VQNCPEVVELLKQLVNKLNFGLGIPGTVGETETVPGVDCEDIKKNNPYTKSGVYTITITKGGNPVKVYCDMDRDGGGWTVFQRRIDGSENFYRPWADYVQGFGNPAKEFWLGNDYLASLTAAGRYQLMVNLGDFENNYRYAKYSPFEVSDSSDKYRLTVGKYSGDAGDSLTWHNGQQFTTYDQDNDANPKENCAKSYTGSWWFNGCVLSDLNGQYNNNYSAKGVTWYSWLKWNSLRFSEMKMRRMPPL
jgi:hypothetical protein